MDDLEEPRRSACCDAPAIVEEGDYVTTTDAIVTIHEPDGTVRLVQPRVAWFACTGCGEKCEPQP